MQIRKNDIILISDFLSEMKRQNKADSTLREYCSRLTIFAKYLQAHRIDITDTDRQILIDFQDDLIKKGLSHRRINVILSTVCSMLQVERQAGNFEKEIVTTGLALPVNPKRIRRLTKSEEKTWMQWLDLKQENIRAAFWLLYGSGARVGEVTKLTKADITKQNGSIYITITGAKWGSDRRVPITHKKAAEIVWSYVQSQSISSEPIFKLKKRTLQNYAHQFYQETGINFKCHLLRHMYASRLLEQGVPMHTIQYLLGHKTIGMTIHYTQAAVVDLSAVTPKIN